MKRSFFTLFLVSCFIAGLSLISPSSLMADDGKVSTEDGILKLTSEDGKFSYQLDARVYLDAALYNEDEEIVDLHSGSEVRRLRFAIKATLWENFLAELDLDFADNEVGIKDAFIAYVGKNWMVKAGNFRAPFSLEEVTTSRYISFIERALPNAFPPGRKIGIGAYKWGKNWQVAAGIFGQEAGDIDEELGADDADESYNIVGRASYAPLYKGNNVIHIGAAYSYQNTDAFGEQKMRFRGYDETKISKIRFLSTGKVKDVDHSGMLGLESVFQFGPFHLQGEYMNVNVARLADSGKPDYKLSGGYVFGSFFVTGESMPYYADQGEFGRIIPKKKGGALELLARYSWLNLNDLENDIEGGEGKNLTFGISWYLNPNYKIMFNYTNVDHDKYADADGDWVVPEDGFDYSIFAVRLMVAF